MTDLIDAPTAPEPTVPNENDAQPPSDGGRPLEWAPREPAPKKHRTGLWVGLGLGAILLAGGAASTILIAPGTTVAGIPVGGLTPGAAVDAVEQHLASTAITLTGSAGDQVVTGADLGASIDAQALVDQAFAEHPMWNVGAWLPGSVGGTITLDPTVANEALRGIVPGAFEDAVDATVIFDESSSTYVTTPAEAGTGIDLDALTAAISATVAEGGSALSFSGDATDAPAAISDDDAAATAGELNAMLANIGFYVGEERTVPVSAAVASTWLDVVDDGGELHIVADSDAIQATVDTLAAKVDRAAVDETAVVNGNGDVLQEITAGANGRALGDVSTVADDFAAQLETGDAVYPLNVEETAYETVSLHRYIDVNLSTQNAVLYENGTVVNSWYISSGLPGTPTPTGNFTVFAHTSLQNMGCYEGASYCTKDVPWNTWFAPDIAFHGAYWHNNFGNQMSHGCVNMPVDVAKYVYDWAPVGTEVSVHW